MTERAYTVAEIDKLRSACRDRCVFGTTDWKEQSRRSRMGGPAHRQSDLDKSVEELVRTYMLAGIVAADIYEEDTRIAERIRAEIDKYEGGVETAGAQRHVPSGQ